MPAAVRRGSVGPVRCVLVGEREAREREARERERWGVQPERRLRGRRAAEGFRGACGDSGDRAYARSPGNQQPAYGLAQGVS